MADTEAVSGGEHGSPGHGGHPHPNQTEIIVNGRPRRIDGDVVTFDQVVALAYPGPHNDDVIFTVTFRHADQHPSSGELAPGGKVKVKGGTVFNVTRTVKS